MTKEERLIRQRISRKENKNKHTHKYEKTHRGFLMRLYRNMQSRIEGVQRTKAHLYSGLNLLAREEFYCWAMSDPTFYTLFENWKQSGYERKLTPSVDRIDSSVGYTLDNMEFVTMSENSRRGDISRHENTRNTRLSS